MKPSSSLTKTCASCGQQKPLSAFLQLAGAQGTTYGNICASCRKTQAKKTPKSKEVEEGTTSSTGVRIDSKTKVQDAREKRHRFHQTEQDYFEGREEKNDEKVQQTEKVISIAKDEKRHRESFLDKRPFLDSAHKAKPPLDGLPIYGSEEHKAREGKLDFAGGPVDYTRVAGTLKTQSSIFLAFKNWLGNAPIVSAAEKAAQQVQNNQDAPTSPSEKAEPDALNEYLDKFRPKSRK